MKKRIIALVLTAALAAAALTSCGSIDKAKNDLNSLANALNSAASGLDGLYSGIDGTASGGDSSQVNSLFAAQAEINSKLTNYYLTWKSNREDGTSTLSKELYIKGEVLISMSDDSKTVTYNDYTSGKAYTLNTEDKTGKPYGSASDTGGGLLLNGILVAYGVLQSTYLDNPLVKTEKVGSDTVAGRAATAYSYTFGGATVKFWIDDEYGLVLKTEGGSTNWEVTEFKIGGVTPTDWINLGAYNISSGY